MRQRKTTIQGQEFDLFYDVDPDFGGSEWANVADWCIKNVRPEDTFLDIGAYLGFMSVAVAHFVKPKYIVAVEPDRRGFVMLEKNLAPYPNCAIVNQLVLDDARTQKMYLNLDNPAQNSIYPRQDLENKATERMTSTTVDRLFEQFRIDGPAVLKIDVEMAEPLVWRGMQKSLPQIRAFLIEYQPEHLHRLTKIDPNDFINEIKRAGYRDEFVTGANLAFYRI